LIGASQLIGSREKSYYSVEFAEPFEARGLLFQSGRNICSVDSNFALAGQLSKINAIIPLKGSNAICEFGVLKRMPMVQLTMTGA
jgi:hypothetical protein